MSSTVSAKWKMSIGAEVIAIKGMCPVFKIGDKILIRGTVTFKIEKTSVI